jgi:hypothetical protein
MLKKFFIAIGVVSVGFVASCALLIGFNAVNDAPRNKAVAEAITRDLARGWNAGDLQRHFQSTVARQINFAEAQAAFNTLKPLGSLARIDEAKQTGFQMEKNLGSDVTKIATVAMVAAFEHGRANVTVELRSEAGQMKLWHINVTPIGGVPAAPGKGNQV